MNQALTAVGLFLWGLVFFYFCLFVVIKPENQTSPRPGLVKPLGVYPLGRVTHPAVQPKVYHCLETLYIPTEVNTLQVDGLARIPGLT